MGWWGLVGLVKHNTGMIRVLGRVIERTNTLDRMNWTFLAQNIINHVNTLMSCEFISHSTASHAHPNSQADIFFLTHLHL